MRKKTQVQSQRQNDAAERAPKRGQRTGETASKRAGAPRKVARDSGTGEFVTKAAAKASPKTTTVETVGRKGKAVPRKPKEEAKFQIIGFEEDKGNFDASEWLTKGEMFAFLAEQLINEDTGEIDESGGITGFTIPKELAECADRLYETRQRRLKHDHASKAMKSFETALKEHLINNLPKSSATGAAGKVARAQIETEDMPVAENWDETYKYIKRTGQFDLLNRAINRRAVRERWNAGKEVPGVGHFQAVKVSITKVGGVK